MTCQICSAELPPGRHLCQRHRDELLSEIERIPDNLADAEVIATARTGYPAALRALQAVLRLHRREVRTARMRYYCGRCGDSTGWPCPTIQAIQEVYGDE